MRYPIYDADFGRPFHGLTRVDVSVPSTEVLGYFQSSALRTLIRRHHEITSHLQSFCCSFTLCLVRDFVVRSTGRAVDEGTTRTRRLHQESLHQERSKDSD